MTSQATPQPRVTWLTRWGAIAPLLLAEFIVWVGFGALLPVLPIYFTSHGVDLATLGLVIAAWPAARLIGEPAFGWLADRTPRVPLMVAGLLLAGIFTMLPLALAGPLPFIVLRAATGLSTAIYDPAARGVLTDATPRERRGEAFGLYGAAQMGGLLLGPAIGALGADRFGGIGFVFIFGGLAAILAAIPIALRSHETGSRTHTALPPDGTEFPPDSPSIARRAAAAMALERAAAAAIVAGSILPAITGFLYTRLVDPDLAIPLILVEATGFALLNPALYAVVATNSPAGRSSTAQGLFGAAGTVGFIIASLVAGVLAGIDILYPLYVFSAVMTVSLVAGLVIGGRRLGR